ncbi:AP2 [Babesia gibsoni]|uniref:AP2 n=1 Tax=Babesia gibsoni TaxID=33632 RepID=A0AAD8PFP0_BABGI|nr:AP2 [Babesia gibsoni]
MENMTIEQRQDRLDGYPVNYNRQIRSFPTYYIDVQPKAPQTKTKSSGAAPFDPRMLMENDIYSHGTELYVDLPLDENYTVRQDAYGQEHAATPKEHFNMAQLPGSKGSYMFNNINELKDPAAQYAAAKYGGVMGYTKLPKVHNYGFPQGGEFYLGPPLQAGQQGDLAYNDWHPRVYSMYNDSHIGGNDSINSTVDGDSVDDIDESIGADGTLPPPNKRDPIYTAVSGLKWKAKSKKWVVRWDNPITNRRVYKYFSGVRYGFMGAHKRAKYYLEFLNASVGRLDAPSVGNPFCRRTEGPPKGKTNKGLIRKLMNKGRPENIVKVASPIYGYSDSGAYQENMEYARSNSSATMDHQPKYIHGSSMDDPYCPMDGVVDGY